MNEARLYTADEMTELRVRSYRVGYDDGFADGRDQGSKDVYDELSERSE